MEIKLGKKIKALRKERNISQEVLAEALGISFQAVSKWENESAMPDVALIPAIASYFGVSTDELFDYNVLETEKKVMQIVDEAAKCRDENPAKAEKVLRAGLKLFPGNGILLNNLLYTMRSPERSEEVVTICKALIENFEGYAVDEEIRFDALRILAETYAEMGQKKAAEECLDKLPEIYFTKLGKTAELLDGEASLKAAESQLWLSSNETLKMLNIMSKYWSENGNTAVSKKCSRIAKKIVEAFKSEEADFNVSDYYELMRKTAETI